MNPLEPFDIEFRGINLIEASAGTGKTYNITSLYVRALIERGLTVSQILVVTYTDAATKELKDRLLKRLRQSIDVLKRGETRGEDQFLDELIHHTEEPELAVKNLTRAIRNFDDASIYTIHGFCYQVLQEHAFESGALYDAELIGDDSELVLEAVDDYWRNWVEEASSSQRPLLKLLLDRKCLPEQLAGELSPFLGKSYLHILPEEKRISNLDETLKALQRVFNEMKQLWEMEREHLFNLLNRGQLKRYGKKSLQQWFMCMDRFLALPVAPIGNYGPLTDAKFENFTQTKIDTNLKKAEIEKGTAPPRHQFFRLTDQFKEISEELNKFDSWFKQELLQYLQAELSERKEELQVLSYDDLLIKLQQALLDDRHGKKLAKKLNDKYPIALVDEFQDTDPCQYAIFRAIYEPWQETSTLFMIGDPKQSIYSFRGADVFAYLQAKNDADSRKIFSLGRNFRSTPELIEGINKLFERHDNPFILGEISYNAVEAAKTDKNNRLLEEGRLQAPIQFRNLSQAEKPAKKGPSEQEAAIDTAKEIRRLISGGKAGQITLGSRSVQPKDIAVLVRTHKQAGLICAALQKERIKSVQYSQESVFQSDEAHQLQIILKAVADPANETYVKTALSVSLISFTALQLLNVDENETEWLDILEKFRTWHKQWQQKGFQFMFRSFLKDADICSHLMDHIDGERRLTNLLHLGELLHHEDRRRKGSTRGLIKWLAQKRKEGTTNQEEAQLRLESDEALVKIVTMHRSKGLEYPIVFCPFLWKGPEYKNRSEPLSYHDAERPGRTILDFHGKSDPLRSEKRVLVARERLAEDMRLAYVAMTRAEHRCYFTWIHAARSEFSPLGCLLFGSEKILPFMAKSIKQKYKPLNPQKSDALIEQLCHDFPDNFSMSTGIKTRDEATGDDQPKALSRRKFSRAEPLKTSYNVSSFSSLTAVDYGDIHLPDYDQFIEMGGTKKAVKKTIFTFPKGPQAGTCLHHIFENIDFRHLATADEVIRRQLASHGFDTGWEKVIRGMVGTVIDKPLLENNEPLKLSNISSTQLIPELEFYFRSGDIQSSKLLSIIRDEPSPNYGSAADSGFLKGFIDLTFQFEDKFYILDYKSNHLGDAVADYAYPHLAEEIRDVSYDLQYHIYTVALHRYLESRLPNYSYEMHFGGAFYLFLRGMNEENSNGIFFHRPDVSIIKQLDEYMLEGEAV